LPLGFFVKDGRDRFGIADQRPEPLADLPKFANESLDPSRCGGDIVVQACANDPQVAVHAIRNLARVGFGTAAVRYSQLGFGRTSSTTREQSTPRNMFGFKDGTANIKARGHRFPRRARRGIRRRESAMALGRNLSGFPADPDAHRTVGPRHPEGTGAGDRTGQVHRGAVGAPGCSSSPSCATR
jgi:deferrochelatase/peroxidase EfeB